MDVQKQVWMGGSLVRMCDGHNSSAQTLFILIYTLYIKVPVWSNYTNTDAI